MASGLVEGRRYGPRAGYGLLIDDTNSSIPGGESLKNTDGQEKKKQATLLTRNTQLQWYSNQEHFHAVHWRLFHA